MERYEELQKLLDSHQLLKIISGIDNFDFDRAQSVVRAASIAKANAIDLSVDEKIVTWTKENYDNLIIFVSSLDPEKLALSIKWGADVLELGNFDALYREGKTIDKNQVIKWTRELRSLAGNSKLCITVPGKLEIEEQINVATQLQAAGADIIQVENLVDMGDKNPFNNVRSIIEVVEIPVIVSGKLNITSLPVAQTVGANGYGIGKVVNSLPSLDDMVDMVKQLSACIKNAEILI
jgi:hypothetical protein